MQHKFEKIDEEQSKNQSDSDCDWTLVSPHESANSSSSTASGHQDQENASTQYATTSSSRIASNISKKQRKEQTKSINQQRTLKESSDLDDRKQAEEELRASGSQDADDEEDDGLVEIDLNVDDEVRGCARSVPDKVIQSSLRPRKQAKSVEFACQAILVQQQQTSAKTRDCSTNTQNAIVASQPLSASSSSTSNGLEMIKRTESKIGELQQNDATEPPSSSLLELSSLSSSSSFRDRLYSLSILILILLVFAKMTDKLIDEKSHKRFIDLLSSLKSANNKSEPFDLFYIDPEDSAYVHLKKLDTDLEACIKERGFGWLKEDGQMSHPKGDEDLADSRVPPKPKYKPFRGVVCYEREGEWRKRLKKLKEEYNVDLRKLSKQGYKRLASNFLRQLQPELRFSLILNQVEYLNYLDELRRREEVEKLKRENHELKKRLMKLNGRAGSIGKSDQEFAAAQTSRSLSRLKNENGKLKRENDALKASLVEKAGTVYIKQSLELEKCERENNLLRQFHQQVGHEITRSLKQLDLHTIDTAALLNDHGSLSSQLALTRGYLMRLGEEVSKLVIKSRQVEKESEFYRVLLDTLETTPRAKQIEHNNNEDDAARVRVLMPKLDSWHRLNSMAKAAAAAAKDHIRAFGQEARGNSASAKPDRLDKSRLNENKSCSGGPDESSLVDDELSNF